jgi:hypothetical protein
MSAKLGFHYYKKYTDFTFELKTTINYLTTLNETLLGAAPMKFHSM